MTDVHRVEIAIENSAGAAPVWRVQLDFNDDNNPGYHADWITGRGKTLADAADDMYGRFQRRLLNEGR